VHKSVDEKFDVIKVRQWRETASNVNAVFVPFNDSTRATLTPVRDVANDSGARYALAKRELARAEDDNATSKRLYEDTANHFVADAIRVSVMALCVLCMAAALMNLETIKKMFIQNIATRNRRYETLIG